jgi:hypothetical protein
VLLRNSTLPDEVLTVSLTQWRKLTAALKADWPQR